ncbi:hypothetical protein, partial [Pseudomonas endophytica]|uniref:hypothetical protein n=1 Tax=Pseudomonas endophytica TaxID=1563157 RepID=UPI0019D38051
MFSESGGEGEIRTLPNFCHDQCFSGLTLASASGPECVKTLSQTLAMISEDFIAGIVHETLYPR